jgi:urocanate hydratase
MDARLRAVLTNDPGIGVIRHLDAGYAEGAGLPLGPTRRA